MGRYLPCRSGQVIMNTGIFILVVLLAVAWWISGKVHRLQANKQEQLDDELALARIVGVLEE